MNKWLKIGLGLVLLNMFSISYASEEQATQCQLYLSRFKVIEISHGFKAIEATLKIGNLPEGSVVESVGFWGQEYTVNTLTQDWHVIPPDFRVNAQEYRFTFIITHDALAGYLAYRGTFFVRLNNSHRYWINPNSNPNDHYIFDTDLMRFLRHMQLLPASNQSVSSLEPTLTNFNHLKCR